jgi:hypothetical protein
MTDENLNHQLLAELQRERLGRVAAENRYHRLRQRDAARLTFGAMALALACIGFVLAAQLMGLAVSGRLAW